MTEETPAPKRRRGRPPKAKPAPVVEAPVVEEPVVVEEPTEALVVEAPVVAADAPEPDPVVEPAPVVENAPDPVKQPPKGPFTAKPTPKKKKPTNAPRPPVRILKEKDDITFRGKLVNNEVIVLEEVRRQVYATNSKRPSYYLVYPYGAKLANTSVILKQAELTNEDNA